MYGFAVDTSPTYRGYDWSVLTTVAWKVDPDLIQLAHDHGRRVELNAGPVRELLAADSYRREQWVSCG